MEPKSFWGLNWLQNQDFGQSITKARERTVRKGGGRSTFCYLEIRKTRYMMELTSPSMTGLSLQDLPSFAWRTCSSYTP
jgi:hypothetical protein